MKKFFIIAAAALATLASCTKVENEVPIQHEIGFSTLNRINTKAPIAGTSYKTTDPKFSVFAAINEDEQKTWAADGGESLYMNNVTIGYDVSDSYKIWRPMNAAASAFATYYWPLTGKLTFQAYTPASVNGSYTLASKTLTITDYSPAATVAEQADVMYSKASEAADKKYEDQTIPYTEGGSVSKGIKIVFYHALSQVVFQAKTNKEYTDAKFNIDYIKVGKVNNKGTLNVVNDAVDNSSAVDGWTTSEPVETPFDINASTADLVTKDYATYGDALLLLPQTFSDDAFVEIKYTLTPDNGTKSSKVVTLKLNDSEKINLATINAGKKYIIQFQVGLNEILFSPAIAADWTEETYAGAGLI